MKGLRGYFSEWALMRYRVLVEVKSLSTMSGTQSLIPSPGGGSGSVAAAALRVRGSAGSAAIQ